MYAVMMRGPVYGSYDERTSVCSYDGGLVYAVMMRGLVYAVMMRGLVYAVMMRGLVYAVMMED